jgi:uncharacterized membrane protein (DUF373 family)
MDEEHLVAAHPTRMRVVKSLEFVEDVAYVGLGVLLTIAALTLLAMALKTFITALLGHSLDGQIVSLLDQILLTLLVIELLYTVRVSFREHGLVAEPFLVIALIAVVRRVLVTTAELPKLSQASEEAFRHAILELALLAAMVLVLVGSLILLQRQARQGGSERADRG